ncbi:MAG: malectin domain-containing carbohydrate-binding protein [Bacteroidales bacterium]|nr:malectin domain-containing carbohydrate-binding protein [Bacteroidales bacterium]
MQNNFGVGEGLIQSVSPYSAMRGAPGIEYIYRVNCGGQAAVDHEQQQWMADTLSTHTAGSTQAKIQVGVAGKLMLAPAADQPILQSYREGDKESTMGYRVPVEPFGSYCVEIYLQEPEAQHPEERKFRMIINGHRSSWIDLCQMTGRNTVIKLVFTVRPEERDYIDIRFPKNEKGNAIVSAIAVGKL